MSDDFLFSLTALISLVPAALVAWRRGGRRDAVFWAALAAGIAGPSAWCLHLVADTWHTGLSTALWFTVATSMWLFGLVALVTGQGWRLTPLVAPYMIVVALLAMAWQTGPKVQALDGDWGWLSLHIVVSVLTYGMVTIAGVAALAAFLQERALKRKHPNALTRHLPSVADSERLVVRLLSLGEVVLGIGLITGMALSYRETGALAYLDHKTVLSVLSFVVIGLLLIAHFRSGLRGRLAARVVLLAYLLLTLGYPGVKFVTDVIMAT
ncbi:MAG: cytochrome c biogenesis protein CcsA [Hyphomicrobiales bacterium]|nr:cytochrome c biogenesis protein CcsA [Hyphomicrobiales bacterium]